jgi:hypothetical protein
MLTPAVSEDLSQLVHFEASGKPDGSRVPSDGRRLFGFDAEALAACMVAVGEPAWRGRQLAEALYRQRVTELDAMTTLPKTLRQRLADRQLSKSSNPWTARNATWSSAWATMA